ncbi:MAG: sigma-54-dependent Fis family transcriptional regulator [Planctomycetes bacterium]|nr:sigma-54-dependent Fis family transcriptional regulator [Planctomycetota bacterium]
MAKILIADDHQGMRDMIVEMLLGLDHEATGVTDGLEARQALAAGDYDLLVTDLRMPGLDGMALLRSLRDEGSGVGVIVMTAHGSVESAVEAMSLGALDFAQKPFPLSAIEAKVKKALERLSMTRTNQLLRDEINQRFGSLIGGSPSMQRVFELIAKVSETTTPVLVLGESGTGKELVARELHRRSPRADGPFITVNCAALAEGLLESELFGHERGAFTGAVQSKKGKFELAHEGTLFLDEVGEIPLATQVKLLRFLQEKEMERVGGNRLIKVDVRVVCATNRNVKELIADGRFREDLFYRINVITVEMPPLRERREDIPLLVEALLRRHAANTGLQGTVADDAMNLFQIYEWPGNVRELENVLERALVLADAGASGHRRISGKDLPAEIQGGEGAPAAQREYMEASGLSDQIERIEREIIRKALVEAQWNQTKAAKALHLKRSSLQYKMKKYELQRPEEE